MFRKTIRVVVGSAIALSFASIALAQQKIEMKVAHFIPAPHPVAKWIERWAEDMAKNSGGRIESKYFPGGQMGPPPVYYDLARNGQAEVVFFLSGGTPGRFPITELINLPYLVGSGEIGAKVLNEPELRTKYLDPEHKGVRILLYMTHQPGQIFTTKKAIRTVEDMKGDAHSVLIAHHPRVRRRARRNACWDLASSVLFATRAPFSRALPEVVLDGRAAHRRGPCA